MDTSKYLAQTTETVVTPMLEMIAEFGAEDYSKRHVKKCERLIHSYLKKLGAMSKPTNDAIMKQVKKLVLALNKLNEATDYALIETGEREAIWEIIQHSAIECGLTDASDDITEEWRDW